jgi:hypothetical protein
VAGSTKGSSLAPTQPTAGQFPWPVFFIMATTPPAVSGVSPNSGAMKGGTPVQINGSGFTGASAVMFGTVAAATFDVNSDSIITATSPVSPVVGPVDVTVTVAGQTSTTSTADLFTYVGPIVTSISPNGGPSNGGTAVTIHGSGLSTATSVIWGGYNDYTVPPVVTDSMIVADSAPQSQIPGWPASVDIQVVTDYGTSATSPADVFSYSAEVLPVIQYVSPLGASGSLPVPTVRYGAPTIVYASAMVCYGSLPAPAVMGANGPQPVVTGVSPASINQYGIPDGWPSNTNPFYLPLVKISGQYLLDAPPTVLFGGVPAVSWYSDESGTLYAQPPPMIATGTLDVTVQSQNGTSPVTSADQVTYYGPMLADLDLQPVAGTTAVLYGAGLLPADGSAAWLVLVGANGQSVAVQAVNQQETSLNFTVPAQGGTNAQSPPEWWPPGELEYIEEQIGDDKETATNLGRPVFPWPPWVPWPTSGAYTLTNPVSVYLATEDGIAGGSAQFQFRYPTPGVAAPLPLIATGTLPAPAVLAAVDNPVSTTAPALMGSGSLPNPAVTAGHACATSPSALVATGSLPTPFAGPPAAATAHPAAETATGSLPAPTVTAASAALAGVGSVTATGSLPSPSVSAYQGATAFAAPTKATGILPDPTVLCSVAPPLDALSATGSLPPVAAGPDASASATPDALEATGSLPSPTPVITLVASASALSATGSLPLPGVELGAGITPDPLVCAGSLLTPAAGPDSDAEYSSATLVATGSLPLPSPEIGVNQTMAALTATGSVLSLTWALGICQPLFVITATGSLPAPTVIAGHGSTFAAPALAAIGSLPVPVTDQLLLAGMTALAGYESDVYQRFDGARGEE